MTKKKTINMSRRSLMGAGIVSATGAMVYGLRQLATPMDPPVSLLVDQPSTLLPSTSLAPQTTSEPESISKTPEKPCWEWRLVSESADGKTWPRNCKVSTYTPEDDGGLLTRTTGAINFGKGGLRENLDYPARYRTLQYINDHRISICAIPLWAKWVHETLREYSKGVWFHRYRVRFPWYDPVDHLRVPCDRVMYRDRHGNLVKQRDRFDMFMCMPSKQAVEHGVPNMPVEIWEPVRVT